MKERSALAGSLIAGLLASACCIGPLVLSALGLGSLGFASVLAPLRPWLLGLTAALIFVGFYFAYRPENTCAPDGSCVRPPSRKSQRVTLWIVTALALAVASYPTWGARRAVSRASAARSEAAKAIVVLNVEGMTCTGCETEIEHELAAVPGVIAAKVNYERGRAEVRVASAGTSVEPLIAAVEKAGYRASLVQQR